MQVQIKNSNQKQIALSLVKQKKYLEALDRYKIYLAKDPQKLPNILIDLYKQLFYQQNNLNIKLIIAEIYIKFSYYNDAIIECEEMLKINPEFSQTYYILSKIYKKKKQINNIRDLFQLAFNKGIRDSIIMDLLPKIYLDTHKIYDCIEFFEQITTESQAHPHHNKALAELYKKIGKHDKCITIYKHLVTTDAAYLPDVITNCESILVTYPNLTFIRTALIDFYTKTYAIDKIIGQLTYLIDHKSISNQTILNYFKQLTITFPKHYNLIQIQCNFLINNNLITDVIQHLFTLTNSLEENTPIIQTYINKITKKNPLHIGFRLFLVKWYSLQNDINQALDIISQLTTEKQHIDILNDCKKYCLDIWNLQHKETQNKTCYLIALNLFYQTKYIDATTYCKQCDPSYLPAITLKLTIMLKQEQTNLLQQCITTHLKNHPKSLELNNLAYAIHKQVIKEKKAQACLSKIETILLELNNNQTNKAIEQLQQIASSDTEFQDAQLLLIRSFMHIKNYTLANNIAEQISDFLKETDKNLYTKSLFLRAICHYQLGEFTQANDVLSKIIQINIQFDYANKLQTHLITIPFTDYYGSAVTGLINIHENNLTITAIQNTLETDLTNQQTTISFGLNHNNQACEYLLKENIKSAEAQINTSCQLDPNLVIAKCNSALIHIINNNLTSAQQAIEDAKKHHSELDIIYLTEGLLFYKKGNLTQAMKSFQHTQKLNPNNLHAQYNLAMIYYLDNNVKLCYQYLNKLTKYGLFFIHIYNHCRYLEKNILTLDDWLTPKSSYEFNKIFL